MTGVVPQGEMFDGGPAPASDPAVDGVFFEDQDLAVAWSVTAPSLPNRGDRPLFSLQVEGRPRPKGNAAGRVIHTKTGPMASVFEKRGLNRPWRKAVRKAAEAAWGERATIDYEVVLECVFMFTRPKDHYVANDRSRPLKERAPRRCTSHACGDLSKLIRCVEDELTTAKVWTDDTLVVGFGHSTKLWSGTDRMLLRVWGIR